MRFISRLPLALLAIASACSKSERTAQAPSEAETVPRATVERRDPSKRAHPPAARDTKLRFTDVSAASGLVLEGVCGDPVRKLALPENIGSGAAVLDYDRDGDLDVFIANGDVYEGQTPRAEPRCALYRNDGGFHFTDVTRDAGLEFRAWCRGAYAVDFDGDGWTDLYVTCERQPNRFFRNLGNGRFEDATATWGGGDVGPSTAAAFFDADQDGDLDLYVGHYLDYDPKDPPNHGEPCEWKGLKVSCGPLGTKPSKNAFYENRGGVLVLATEEFGFVAEPSYTLGVIAADFDRDGDVDLYVANDSRPNFCFENLGHGKFRETALTLGVAVNEEGRAQAGMGLDAGDVDDDGRFDLFVTNFSHDTNTLYHNEATRDGRTIFMDTTFPMKLGEASYAFLSWGTRILDLDRDGWQDIVVVSGHVYPQVDGANLGTSYAQRSQVFRNLGAVGPRGGIVFEDWAPPADDGIARRAVSRGLVAADFDDDGDHDFLVTVMDAKPMLFRNDTETTGHWAGFLLVGAGKNRDAIGAVMEVTDSAGVTRVRQRSFGAGYLSTSDPRLHFGLGPAGSKLRSVTITWPGGAVTKAEGLDADRYYVADESASTVVPLRR